MSKKTKEGPDINVSGPHSSISLKKFLDNEGDKTKEFTLLVDGTGQGIAKDAPEMVYITPEECSKQAIWYSQNKFNGKGIPAYLYRYLAYMFIDKHELYPNDQALAKDFESGKIKEDSSDYQMILGLIKYCDTNKEAAQVIGMIQLISGSLRLSVGHMAGIRFFIEHPETSLHPSRQAKIMNMITALKAEYGPNNKF